MAHIGCPYEHLAFHKGTWHQFFFFCFERERGLQHETNAAEDRTRRWDLIVDCARFVATWGSNRGLEVDWGVCNMFLLCVLKNCVLLDVCQSTWRWEGQELSDWIHQSYSNREGASHDFCEKRIWEWKTLVPARNTLTREKLWVVHRWQDALSLRRRFNQEGGASPEDESRLRGVGKRKDLAVENAVFQGLNHDKYSIFPSLRVDIEL